MNSMPVPKRRPIWPATLAIVFIIALAVAVGLYVVQHAGPSVDPESLIDHEDFECYAVSESARTVAAARIDRKRIQVGRMERLLATDKLDPLDHAKLRAELAIVMWDLEEARFQRDCAEAYFKPGSTHLRKTFETTPARMQTERVGEAFESALDKVEPRLLPHGFEERAHLYLARIALSRGNPDKALDLATQRLEAHPDGLYADSFQLVAADALLLLGRSAEAVEYYRLAGRLKIGLDAHYARYRLAALERAAGNPDEADKLMADVDRWARRGDREALVKVLEGAAQGPPKPSKNP